MSNRIIKKYPNRRLYDTHTSAYITLADVKELIIAGHAIKVHDAKTDEDLTRSIFLQIILEEEAGGQPIFSEAMMQQMIRFYGHAMQSMMGSYLEKTLQMFVEMQGQLMDRVGALNPMANSEQLTQQLMAQFPGASDWGKFLNQQAPLMQSVMNSYIEQSKSVFHQMQEQIRAQGSGLWPMFSAGMRPDPTSPPETAPPAQPGKKRRTRNTKGQ